MEGQNASDCCGPRLTEASYRFPRAMLKVRGASASNQPRFPAPSACMPVPRETRLRLTRYDSPSTQVRRKLMADSAVTTYDHDASRERSASMYPASRGVPLTSCRAAGCPASENEAQEPRTFLRLRKRGLGPSLGVCWRGFPQLTCLSARQRASAGPFRSGGRKASIPAGSWGGSAVSCRTSTTS